MVDTNGPPYGFDFFETLKTINFGGGALWLGMQDTGSTPSQPGVTYDFIGQAGGTPGFEVPQAFHAPPAGPYQMAPAFLKKSDISHAWATGGGLPVTGQFGEWFNLFVSGGSTLWISLKGFPKKFKVRVSFTGSGSLSGGVLLYKAKQIKPGVDLGVLVPDASTLIPLGSPFPSSQIVTVDQDAITVT